VSDEKILDDLGFIEGAGPDKWEEVLQEKLGLKIVDLQKSICDWVTDNIETLSQDFINICPSGDYGKLIEDYNSISKFLKEETTKPEAWKIMGVRQNSNPNMIQFIFDCDVVDEGDTFKGFVFVSKTGKIRHAFAQNQS